MDFFILTWVALLYIVDSATCNTSHSRQATMMDRQTRIMLVLQRTQFVIESKFAAD